MTVQSSDARFDADRPNSSLSAPASVPVNKTMTPPILAFIDCNIVSGQDEIARESLMTHVGRYRSAGVAPLFVTWLRERSDLRFVCMVRNLSEFNDFMLDVVRSVEGVRSTRTMLSFGGRADLDTLLELEMEVSANGHLVAASLWIDVQPGQDRRCFQALLDLPPHPDVRRVWLLNCYHSEDADLQMLLLGKNVAALTGYVMSWIRTTPGVIDTEISTVLDWRWLASPDDLVELCELFFTRSAREHRQEAKKLNGQKDAPLGEEQGQENSQARGEEDTPLITYPSMSQPQNGG